MPTEIKGKILKCYNNLFEVAPDDGSPDLMCHAKGAFRHDHEKPIPGDHVLCRIDENPGIIVEIEKRKNRLIRPPVANLDRLYAVISASLPEPQLATFDKLISIAEYNNIEPVILINKSDEAPSLAEYFSNLYKDSGFSVFVVSATQGYGIPEFMNFIRNSGNIVSAFSGASGVGKTTIINSLFPSAKLTTGELSIRIGRGKNTTRHVELYHLTSLCDDTSLQGYIADTPGFGLIDFTRFNFYEKEELPLTFRDFLPYIGKCRYTKCTHTKEEGCAILQAIQNKNIRKERHESFLKIYNDIKNIRKWDDKRKHI